MQTRINHQKESMMNEKNILFVVTKIEDLPHSEEVLSHLSKGSPFRIIPLTAEQWQFQRNSFKDSDKVLFIGNIAPVLPLQQKMPLKYDQFGIRYGWLGNRAALICDRSGVKDRDVYHRFLNQFRKETAFTDELKESKDKDILDILAMVAFAFIVPFGILAVGGKLLKDYFENEGHVKKQQYIFGIFHFYKYHLKEFME